MMTISQLTATLADLRQGQRAWFWFCENTAAMPLPFLLLPVEDDPGMDVFTELVKSLRMPEDATECLGLAYCDEEGKLHFGSSGTRETTLPALAGWVQREIGRWPRLNRLANARFVHFDQDRRITASFEDSRLWEGIPTPPASGGIEDAAAALQRLQPGQGAWFWAVEAGPHGLPFAVIVPVEDDPHADELALRARDAVQRSVGQPDAVVGTLQILSTGKLVLSTQDDLDEVKSVLALLARRPGFQRLTSGLVFAQGEHGFEAGEQLGDEPPADAEGGR